MHYLIRALMLAIVLTAIAQLNLFPVRVAAQQPTSSGAVELRPGVVIDPQRRVAYLMNPKGGIDAVGLNRGELVWHSDDAARPVAAAGTVLVAQAEPPRPTRGAVATAARPQGNELLVRVLDARTGRRRLAVTHLLPPGTRANVVGTAEGTFSIQSQATSPTETILAWEFVDIPLQGVRPGALDVDAPPADTTAAVPALALKPGPAASGAVRIDLTSGKAAAVSGPTPLVQSPRRADIQATDRVASVTGDQFLSSDGRHVLASERIADDSVWDKYQWTVFDRSGQRVGTLRDYRSHAPFLVVGTTMYYETGPFDRRTESGAMVSEPLRIRALELAKGAQLWIRAVRDTTYRGPFPS